jgi:acetyl-CoA carboxylase biotin carboxyl carrier protein
MSETEPAPETGRENASGGPFTEAFADARLARELANVLNDTGLSEIEIERGDLRVRVVRTLTAPTVIAPPPIANAPPAPTAPPASAAPAAPTGDVVKSPMVGTVYLQSQPGAAPFVTVGSRVNEGQTLLLVEAMKTMNPIVAPRAGMIIDLLVTDGQPVEYGEPLAVIG